MPRRSGITQCLSFCERLVSLSIIFSRFIFAVACIRISFLSKSRVNAIHCRHTPRVACSSVGRLLDYFHIFTAVNEAAVNVAVLVSVWDSAAPAKSLQSCLTLCDTIDGSPPGSSVPGILQARTLKWVGCHFLLQRKETLLSIILDVYSEVQWLVHMVILCSILFSKELLWCFLTSNAQRFQFLHIFAGLCSHSDWGHTWHLGGRCLHC